MVVLQNGGPVSLAGGGGGGGQRCPTPPAILDMFWAGEEGGTAIADVLFGDYNPAGRLPYTVYQSVQDIPPMMEYDISKGFTYMYFDGEPDCVFGHGLSYTTFDYSNLKISGSVPDGPMSVTTKFATPASEPVTKWCSSTCAMSRRASSGRSSS